MEKEIRDALERSSGLKAEFEVLNERIENFEMRVDAKDQVKDHLEVMAISLPVLSNF